MQEKITLTINGNTYEYYSGTSLYTVSKYFRKDYEHDIILARVDGKLSELFLEVNEDAVIEFVTTDTLDGYMVYRRTANMIMQKAFRDVYGKEEAGKVICQYSIDKGYYYTTTSAHGINKSRLAKVKARMQEIVEADIDIVKRPLKKQAAMRVYEEMGRDEKLQLMEFSTNGSFNNYILDDYMDYYYGYMAPATSLIRYFDLYLLDEGFVLQLPTMENPEKVSPFNPPQKLFTMLKRTANWNELMGVSNIAQLNQSVTSGKFSELVLVQEALMEREIGHIAEQITEAGKRVVLIAGPSSSGKTSFSHRLSIQLKANGLCPHPIPVDSYFVDRDKTPKNPDGSFNFECLGALDLEKFNSDMQRLLAGEAVHLSSFNFMEGKSNPDGPLLQIGPKDVLVIEGIHSLNDAMTYALSRDLKYKIYISALTSLNIDDHNRISTSDGRLIRRMCRDAVKRGTNPAKTIGMWQSVKRGEEENIFPYQEDCDIMFNSTLIYELAVLKQYACSLLYSVKPDQPEYDEARRMLRFMEHIVGADSLSIPNNSIIREFIGGSCFNVE